MRIAQLQMPVFEDKRDTVKYIEKNIKNVNGADFVTLPEMFCCPYEAKNFPVYAEPEKGTMWQFLSDIAKKNKIYLSAGTMPENDNGKIYNTAYVFDREGRQIAKYRKSHLFDIDVKGGQCFHESDTLTAGNEIVTFDTEFGKFGICICYDLRFPEMGRIMAEKGAKALIVPAAFNMTTGPAHWELTYRAQAVFNQVYTIGTAPARDMNASYTSWGHSIVVSPWGEVLSQLDEKEGIAITDIDFEKVDEVREQLPLLKHRRKDMYTLKENK